MTDDRNPIEAAVEQAMDAFVYAPIGLVFDGPALFPTLVEKGRNQVQVARMMGKMAVQMGQAEAGKRVAAAEGPIREMFVAMGVVPSDEPGTPAAAQPEPTVASTTSTKASAPRSTAATKRKAAAKKAPASTKRKAATRKSTSRKAAPTKTAPASTLGIPDYDSLSASQVVKRLRGMDAGELEAVQAYEAATRARKTILNRIAQLQKG